MIGGVYMLTGIIMASGFSKRMGENKLLLSYKEKRIFEFVIDTFLEAKDQDIIDDLIVVTNNIPRLLL